MKIIVKQKQDFNYHSFLISLSYKKKYQFKIDGLKYPTIG
jgi:hypothetical protein